MSTAWPVRDDRRWRASAYPVMLASGRFADLATGDLFDIADCSGVTGHTSYANGAIEVTGARHSISFQVSGGLPGSGLLAATTDSPGELVLHV